MLRILINNTDRVIIKRTLKRMPIIKQIVEFRKKNNDKKLAVLRAPLIAELKELLPPDISIISSNCFAGRIMQDLGMEYNSPTLGLWVMPDDYPTFCGDLHHYLSADVMAVEHSKNALGNYKHSHWKDHPYPIGLIDGKLEVHFLHYHNHEEAISKWKRRASRVNFDKVLIIGMEQNGCTEANIKAFDSIPYEGKLFFATKPYLYKSVVYVPEFEGRDSVGDPYKDGHIFYRYLVEWLKVNKDKIGKYE